MFIWHTVFLLGFCILQCCAREPIKPRVGSVPFSIYYFSRYRGICVGALVARSVAITAAVCVIKPGPGPEDRRPINVILGSPYRHPGRGVRVQVSKIVVPLLGDTATRVYIIQKSPALLLLARKVPDILAEVPTRGIDVDWSGDDPLTLQEECVITGWHFFNKGDKIFPILKFHLQRNLRVQFLNTAKQNLYCEALILKYRKALSDMGYNGDLDSGEMICARDGMYGAPFICKGRVVGLFAAPDAQWRNCTGKSVIIHLLSNPYLKPFFNCVKDLFDAEFRVEWNTMKNAFYDDYSENHYDYVPAIYDKLMSGESAELEDKDC